jgi:hypothetical protein
VLKFLRSIREEYQQVVLRGETLSPNSAEQTAMQTIQVLGRIYGLNLLLDLKRELLPNSEEEA